MNYYLHSDVVADQLKDEMLEQFLTASSESIMHSVIGCKPRVIHEGHVTDTFFVVENMCSYQLLQGAMGRFDVRKGQRRWAEGGHDG